MATSTHAVTLSTAKIIAPEQGTAAYTVSLAAAPTADVTVTLTKNNTGDANITFTPSTLTFTTTNYSTAQTVTVAAADDTDKDYGTATITHTTASTDSNYSGLTADLAVSEGDNDVCQGTAAVSNATTGGLVDDCNTLLAAKATLVGTATLNPDWATTTAIATWQGITVANSRVSRIILTKASLDGSIPNTLGNLTYLRRLWLNQNSLTGSIPASLGNLANITHIYIDRNDLTGTIPTQLGNLTNLSGIYLDVNRLTGTIPTELGNLANLVRLGLHTNDLTGTIPTQLGNLTKLKTLSLAGNDLTGTIPTQLGNLNNLEGLYLHGNNLTGTIPKELGNLTKLTHLFMARNDLSGTIPKELGNLTKLITLTLESNDLSGAIPKELGNLTNLLNLHLGENSLSGAIPKELGNLTKINRLHIQNNSLSGAIPKELGNLTNATAFWFDRNDLSGAIPKELGNLTNLVHLIMDRNDLSGAIPKELGNLTNLVLLRLYENKLTGAIPKELGNLLNLVQLYLHTNSLTGSIPEELGNLAKSNLLLNLYNNSLSGCIPPNLARWGGNNAINPQKDSQNQDVTLDVCLGIRLSAGTLDVNEGSNATYTVRLVSAPTHDVTVTLTEAGDNDITFSPATLTFTTVNYSTTQTVTLAAPADAVHDTGTAVITHTATSNDTNYNNKTTKLTAIEVDTTPILTAVGITQTTALLTIARHSSNWYYQANTGPDTTCKGPVSGSWRRLTGLAPGASYTYTAHSDSTCTADKLLTTARAFTTLSPTPEPFIPSLLALAPFAPTPPADPDTFYSGTIDSPDYCTNLSLGGPRTYAHDSNNDGIADTCSLRHTRRETIARQNALAALAENYPASYAILLTQACTALRNADYGDNPADLAKDACATGTTTQPHTAPEPEDPDTFYSDAIDGPDHCTNLSLGGPRTYAYDSNDDGIADTCSLPHTRRETIARQNALAALAGNFPAQYTRLLTQACTALGDTDYGDHPDDLANDICAP